MSFTLPPDLPPKLEESLTRRGPIDSLLRYTVGLPITALNALPIVGDLTTHLSTAWLDQIGFGDVFRDPEKMAIKNLRQQGVDVVSLAFRGATGREITDEARDDLSGRGFLDTAIRWTVGLPVTLAGKLPLVGDLIRHISTASMDMVGFGDVYRSEEDMILKNMRAHGVDIIDSAWRGYKAQDGRSSGG